MPQPFSCSRCKLTATGRVATNGKVWHVDEVAEDQAGLGIVVAAHATCHETVETGGEDGERHVEVDLEADG